MVCRQNRVILQTRVQFMLMDTRSRSTGTLEAALRELCSPEVPTLRVDVICIDQFNNMEKNQQVQMMGEVYEKSQTNFVWLGPAARHFPGAELLIDHTRHLMSNRPDFFNKWAVSPEELEGIEVYKDYVRQDLERDQALDDIKDFARVTDCSWFGRVWIMQEFVMSRNIFLLLPTFWR